QAVARMAVQEHLACPFDRAVAPFVVAADGEVVHALWSGRAGGQAQPVRREGGPAASLRPDDLAVVVADLDRPVDGLAEGRADLQDVAYAVTVGREHLLVRQSPDQRPEAVSWDEVCLGCVAGRRAVHRPDP